MKPQTAKALSLIPVAPYSTGTTGTDYFQEEGEPRESRAIFSRGKTDLLYWLIAAPIKQPQEDRSRADSLLALMAAAPELLAALDGLTEACEAGNSKGSEFRTRALQHAQDVLAKTVKAMIPE